MAIPNKLSILIGGKAGQGVSKTSLLLGKALSQIGYYVFVYRDYPSLIRGGHNFDIITVSNKPVLSSEPHYDVIVALDQDTVKKYKADLKPEGFILSEKDIKTEGITNQTTINNILLGYLFRLYDLPLKPLLNSARTVLGHNISAQNALKEGYKQAKSLYRLIPSDGSPKYFLSGSEAVASGAITAGLDDYIAYPITPATPVMHLLAKKQKEANISVIQLENEIAVANAALGASFGGATVMLGTSGAGLSLMAEAMSMEGMSEIPLVVYLAQRSGPATGIPTYSGQGDLEEILNIGHGEFLKIVIAPGDPQEAFQRTIESFYLALKYHLLVILVSDKHLAESYYTFTSFAKPRVIPQRFIKKAIIKNYKSYLITKNGISPRLVPGQGPVVRATSYEHNEWGYTIEDSQWATKMTDKRWRKLPFLQKEISRLSPIATFGKGRNLIVGWGSTKGAILDALRYLPDWRFLQISYLSPFPSQKVKRILAKSKKVVLVENNVTGLLGKVIAENTGYLIKDKILRYDARPFTGEMIAQKIKKYTNR